MSAILVLIIDREVITDVAISRISPRLSSAKAERTYRVAIHRPVDDVDVVYVLFDNVVAGQPRKIEPVAQLPFEIAPLGLAILFPETALGPITARCDDLPNLAVVHQLHRLEVADLMAPLRARSDAQPFGFPLFVGGEHAANSRAIHPDRFLGEYVLAGGDCGLQVLRSESGRSSQNDVVHVARDYFLEGVESHKAAIIRHIQNFAYLQALLRRLVAYLAEECGAALVKPVLKRVAHGDKLDAGRRAQGGHSCAW